MWYLDGESGEEMTTSDEDELEGSRWRASTSAAWQNSSMKYEGADPWRHLYTRTAHLEAISSEAFSQWSCCRNGVMLSNFDDERTSVHHFDCVHCTAVVETFTMRRTPLASISCGLVVQQVVRLAVRLADCCMQLAADLLWTCCATSCPTCRKTCCLFYNLLWTSVGFRFVVYDKCTTNRSDGVRHYR